MKNLGKAIEHTMESFKLTCSLLPVKGLANIHKGQQQQKKTEMEDREGGSQKGKEAARKEALNERRRKNP